MDEIDYAPLLPTQAPEGLVSYILGQGALWKEYLVYKAAWEYAPLEERNRPVVEVTCTNCGHTFVAEKIDAGCCNPSMAPAPFGWFNPAHGEGASVISGTKTVCPMCGAEATTYHIGQIPNGIQDYGYTAQICRVSVPGQRDRLAILDWQTCKDVSKSGAVSFHSHIWTAWVVEERKIVRLMGYQKCLATITHCPRPEQRKQFLDYFEKYQFLWPWDGDLEGTTAENSKLDLYIKAGGKWLVSYLALWRRRPAVENLVMQGYGRLVDDLIEREQTTYSYERKRGAPKLESVDWKQSKPNRMLHMGKEEFRRYAGKLTAQKYEALVWTRQNAPPPPKDAEALLKVESRYSLEAAMNVAGAEYFWRCVRYIRQPGRALNDLRDYWQMAGALDMDLDDQQVRWPKDLRRAHDAAAERLDEIKEAELNESFVKRLQQLSAYAWSADGILIRPCATQAELKREGKDLHHCVATYAKGHATGQTAIFFVRREEEPDEPWYTLELDEQTLTVRQNRGLRNCDKTPEVQAFEDAWIEHLKEQRKQEKKAKKAKKKGAKVA